MSINDAVRMEFASLDALTRESREAHDRAFRAYENASMTAVRPLIVRMLTAERERDEARAQLAHAQLAAESMRAAAARRVHPDGWSEDDGNPFAGYSAADLAASGYTAHEIAECLSARVLALPLPEVLR